MSAFCEPATTTSSCQSSWQTGTAPAADTASSTMSAPWAWATSASARTSFTTPVEVSERVVKKTFTSGFSASSRSASAGSTLLPHPAS